MPADDGVSKLKDGISAYSLGDYSIVQEGDGVPVREVRLAVTMVGGSALAIYECGVARELYRMVWGQGLYALLKRLTQSHAYIDILSGTSAGGINTISLSTAIANGTNFDPMSNIWIRMGDIDRLLQDAKNPEAVSLFKGNDYYLQQLKDEFDRLIDPANIPHWSLKGIPSGDPGGKQCTDLDLFVTGTYYEGQPKAFFDARNKPIFTQDYNGIFHLKHRISNGRNESHFSPLAAPPFDLESSKGPEPEESPGSYDPQEKMRLGYRDRLARIARTTSSLPAVFEPSEIRRNLMDGVIELPSNRNVSYMMDGGFLNNQPLNLILGEIYRRPANQEVLRKILFVEPCPEDLVLPRTDEPSPPNALQNLWFYKDVPGRQSLSGCLEGLFDHNQKVRRVTETLEAARNSLQVMSDPQMRTHPKRLWVDLCLRDLRDRLIELWQSALGLSDFGGLIQETGLKEVDESQRRMKAEALRLIRDQLFNKMLSSCDDWILDVKDQLPIKLDFLDGIRLQRLINRAIDEVYQLIFPRLPPNIVTKDPKTLKNQNLRDQLYRTIKPEVYLRVQAELNNLQMLLNQTIIVQNNLESIIKAIVVTDEYKKVENAALKIDGTKDFENAISELWRIIYLNIYSFISKGEISLNEPIDKFRLLFKEKSIDLCKKIKNKQVSVEVPMEFKISIYNEIGSSLGDCLTSIREDLRPVYEKYQHYIDSLNNECGKIYQISIPFGWAYDYKDDYFNYNKLIDFEDQFAQNISFHSTSLSEEKFDGIHNGDSQSSPPIADYLWERLKDLDAMLYPIEEAADLPNLNILELLHVSARDIQIGLSKRTLEDKLAGDSLSHLGGFLKRSWRANDILWGRLDGAGALIETLLDQDRLVRILNVPRIPDETPISVDLMKAIERYILRGDPLGNQPDVPETDDIGDLLQAGYENFRGELRQWLEEGFKQDEALLSEAPCIVKLREILLQRHQYEILEQEVPNVIGAAIAEHSEWQGRRDARPLRLRARVRLKAATPNRTSTPRPLAPPSQSPINNRIVIDATDALADVSGYQPDDTTNSFLQLEANRYASDLFTPNPGEDRSRVKKIVDYFKGSQYAVGREDLEDIPRMVSLRRVLGLLLVALHVIGNILSPETRDLGKLLNRFVLGPITFIVGTLYGLVDVLAQGSGAAIALHAGIWTAIALGMALLLFHAATGYTVPILMLLGMLILFEGLVTWASNIVETYSRALFIIGISMLLTVVAYNNRYFQLPMISSYPAIIWIVWSLGWACIVGSGIWSLFLALKGKSRRVAAGLGAGALLLLIVSSFIKVQPLSQFIDLSQSPYHPLVWLLIATLIFCLVLGSAMHPPYYRNAPRGMVSFAFSGTPAKAQDILFTWGEDGRKKAQWNLIFSFLFIPTYIFLIALICNLASQQWMDVSGVVGFEKLSTGIANVGQWLVRALLVALTVGVIESICLLRASIQFMHKIRKKFMLYNISLTDHFAIKLIQSDVIQPKLSNYLYNCLNELGKSIINNYVVEKEVDKRSLVEEIRVKSKLVSMLNDACESGDGVDLMNHIGRFESVPEINRLQEKIKSILKSKEESEKDNGLSSIKKEKRALKYKKELIEINQGILMAAFPRELTRIRGWVLFIAQVCAAVKFTIIAASLIYIISFFGLLGRNFSMKTSDHRISNQVASIKKQ